MKFKFRHPVDELIFEDGRVVGVRGVTLKPDYSDRGIPSNREVTGDFSLKAQAVVLATGGIGGNHEMVRKW